MAAICGFAEVFDVLGEQVVRADRLFRRNILQDGAPSAWQARLHFGDFPFLHERGDVVDELLTFRLFLFGERFNPFHEREPAPQVGNLRALVLGQRRP